MNIDNINKTEVVVIFHIFMLFPLQKTLWKFINSNAVSIFIYWTNSCKIRRLFIRAQHLTICNNFWYIIPAKSDISYRHHFLKFMFLLWRGSSFDLTTMEQSKGIWRKIPSKQSSPKQLQICPTFSRILVLKGVNLQEIQYII